MVYIGEETKSIAGFDSCHGRSRCDAEHLIGRTGHIDRQIVTLGLVEYA